MSKHQGLHGQEGIQALLAKKDDWGLFSGLSCKALSIKTFN
jgi:hypothetical protein